jgi:hypothetical protein
LDDIAILPNEDGILINPEGKAVIFHFGLNIARPMD